MFQQQLQAERRTFLDAEAILVNSLKLPVTTQERLLSPVVEAISTP